MNDCGSPANVGSMEWLGRCGTCQHWRRYTEAFDVSYHGAHAGTCNSARFVYDGKTPKDGLHYWDYEDHSAGFDTGEAFGCVHWVAA